MCLEDWDPAVRSRASALGVDRKVSHRPVVHGALLPGVDGLQVLQPPLVLVDGLGDSLHGSYG